jgi:hypothetical protein
MSEHFGAFFTCIVLHAALLIRYVRSMLPPKQFEAAVRLVVTGGLCVGALLVTLVLGYVVRSPTFGWTGELARRWRGGRVSRLCWPHGRRAFWHRRRTLAAPAARRAGPARPRHPFQPTRPPHTLPPPAARPLPHAARPHLRVPLRAHHRVGVGAPAAQLGVLRDGPPHCRHPRARGHHRVLQEPHQRCGARAGGAGGRGAGASRARP